MARHYGSEELEQLRREVDAGTSSGEIAAKLGRPPNIIAMKLKKLHNSEPGRWTQEKVDYYVRKLNSEAWRVPRKQPERVNHSRRMVLDFLRKRPDAVSVDIKNAGLEFDFSIAYNGRINAARRDLGLEEHERRIPETLRKQRVLNYLREHPDASAHDIAYPGFRSDIKIVYNDSIINARREAGVILDGYVSGAQAARMLCVTDERVSQLLDKHKIVGYRLGRRMYISLASVEERKRVICNTTHISPALSQS